MILSGPVLRVRILCQLPTTYNDAPGFLLLVPHPERGLILALAARPIPVQGAARGCPSRLPSAPVTRSPQLCPQRSPDVPRSARAVTPYFPAGRPGDGARVCLIGSHAAFSPARLGTPVRLPQALLAGRPPRGGCPRSGPGRGRLAPVAEQWYRAAGRQLSPGRPGPAVRARRCGQGLSQTPAQRHASEHMVSRLRGRRARAIHVRPALPRSLGTDTAAGPNFPNGLISAQFRPRTVTEALWRVRCRPQRLPQTRWFATGSAVTRRWGFGACATPDGLVSRPGPRNADHGSPSLRVDGGRTPRRLPHALASPLDRSWKFGKVVGTGRTRGPGVGARRGWRREDLGSRHAPGPRCGSSAAGQGCGRCALERARPRTPCGVRGLNLSVGGSVGVLAAGVLEDEPDQSEDDHR